MISSFVFDRFNLNRRLERYFHKRISICWKGNKVLRVLVFYPPEKFFTPSPITILIQTPITCVICPNFLVLIDRMRIVVEGVKNFSEWGKKLLENGGKKLLRNNRKVHGNENKIKTKFNWVRVGLVNKIKLMKSKTQVQ